MAIRLTSESMCKSAGSKILHLGATRYDFAIALIQQKGYRKMVKIVFERSGGFLEPPIEITLDVDRLPVRKARDILYLIEDADFFRFPEELVDEPMVDGCIYTITVEVDNMRHRVHVGEMYLSEPLQLLVDELSLLAQSLALS